MIPEKPEGLEALVDWEKPGLQRERHRVIAALLQQKADPNILDFLDWSPLHYACMLGWIETVKLLLEKGANHKQVFVSHYILIYI